MWQIHYYKSLIDDAFYGSIIGALEKEIRQMGYYTMLLIENDRDAIYQAVKSWNMSGLITITFPWQDYHCQQSAEKAIKAVIVSLHWPTGIPKSHDLSFLLNQIHNYISIPDAIGDAADALTPFGTMTRYPNELTVEEHHAKQAIAFAEQILNWTASALR